jgi:Na+-driven multidrug efflux pump
MIISLLAIWMVQLPLASILSKFTSLGAFGVRWGMVAATMLSAIAYTVYFIQGRWKNRKV